MIIFQQVALLKMGCGSSKSVGVADAPEKKAPEAVPVASEKNLSKPEQAEEDLEGAQNLKREKTGLAFDVGFEGPKKKPPSRLTQKKSSGKTDLSEEEIANKLAEAERRREEQTQAKVNALEAEDAKRQRAKQAIANKKNRASKKINEKQTEAVRKREEQLRSKAETSAKDVEEKQKRARARRHEIALQQANDMDVGGEQEDEKNSEEENDDDQTKGTEEW